MGKITKIFILMWALCGAVGCVTEEPTPEPEEIATPAGLEITGTTTSTISIKWNAVEGAESYTYKYKDAAGRNNISADTEQTSATISGLTKDTEYLLTVRANKGSLKSPWAEWLTVRTPLTDTPTEGGGNQEGGNEEGGNDEGGNDEGGNDNTGGEGGTTTPSDMTLAFPGAEGGGMYTTGGRGGVVYHVTNLNDSGAGSLREAINKSGKRTIVFDVAGTIHLKSSLRIKNGDLTIAGQTAPGDGICIAGKTTNIDCDNVIIRYVRFRLGNTDTSQEDAIWGRYHKNIILDHCTMSWSIDECASFYANQNFTMQWCFITEALKNAGHSKGAHGYGGIWGGKNASFHHNLLAHNDSRNPRIDHPNIYDSYLTSHRGNVDYRNNVVYNWGGNSTYGGEGGWFNIVGNYYKPGPASSKKNYFVDANGKYSGKDTGYAEMWVEGNYHAGSYASDINADNWSGIHLHDGTGVSNASSWKLSGPLAILKDDTQQCYVTTHSAADAYEQVLSWGGCSLSRDAIDSRIVGEVRSGSYTYTGSESKQKGIIDSHTEAEGWITLSATASELSAVKDSDGDGMPDEWEKSKGLNPNNASDGNTTTLSPTEGYTNLEVYLASLVEDITAKQVEKGTYTTLN